MDALSDSIDGESCEESFMVIVFQGYHRPPAVKIRWRRAFVMDVLPYYYREGAS